MKDIIEKVLSELDLSSIPVAEIASAIERELNASHYGLSVQLDGPSAYSKQAE